MLDFLLSISFQSRVDSLASINNNQFTVFLIIFKLKFKIFGQEHSFLRWLRSFLWT